MNQAVTTNYPTVSGWYCIGWNDPSQKLTGFSQIRYEEILRFDGEQFFDESGDVVTRTYNPIEGEFVSIREADHFCKQGGAA